MNTAYAQVNNAYPLLVIAQPDISKHMTKNMTNFQYER